MIIVLSPSKALNFTAPPVSAPLTTPELSEHTAELAKTTRKLRAIDLKRMMDLSDDLAKLNRDRFQAFDPDSEEGLQAAFAFNGDVYLGLKARELDKKALAFAQKHVRILSGLYGVLRPLDAIQPYRLEMGVRLKTRRGQSLYDFWFYITTFSRYPMEIYQGPVGNWIRWGFTFVLPILIVVNVPARMLAKPMQTKYWYLAVFAILATSASLLVSRWVFQRALLSYRSASS